VCIRVSCAAALPSAPNTPILTISQEGYDMAIAIIGAGLAASALCRTLRSDGLKLCVFEKSRGPGGRLATRRHEEAGRVWQFDHGAPFLPCANDDPFASCEEASDVGLRWLYHRTGETGIVGIPGMNALVRSGLGATPARYGIEIAGLTREGRSWHLSDTHGNVHGPFDSVLTTCPAPQAARLLSGVHEGFAALAAGAFYDPVWTVMLGYGEGIDLTTLVRRAAEIEGVDSLIHDGGKPGRDGAATLVVHMTPHWSKANLEREKADIAEHIAGCVSDHFHLPAPMVALGHRWRFGRVHATARQAPTFDREAAIGVAGDWLVGPDANDAYASGVLLGNTVSRLHAWGAHSG
jgi:renalase